MRYFSLLALLAASTSLGGCPTGDGSASSLANASGVCGVSDANCATATATTGGTVSGTGGGATSGNTGNNATVVTGTPAVALEKGIIVSTKTTPPVSKLTLVEGTPATATTDAVAATAKFEIDTKTPNNALWPLAKTMEEYLPGTNAAPSPGLGLGGNILGGTYREYRAFTRDAAGKSIDEELQVWSFANSYALQYRDVTASGKPADRQAWSFGGTKTPQAAMALKGTGTYAGKFGATATTSNFINRNTAILDANGNFIGGQTVDNNNDWRVWGDSALQADFVTGKFTGVLTPREWNAFETMNNGNQFRTIGANNVADYNWAFFMDDKVYLKGTISNSATLGNTIAGTTSIEPATGWITNTTSNGLYAGVYGPNADEITGAFGVDATVVKPIGGYFPINDDRRGFITMSGVFNGQ
jgi:hypothetical protein